MSGTVQTKAQLLAGVASGQPPGSITPVQIQNIVASIGSVAANQNAPGAASGRYYTGVDPQGFGQVTLASGSVAVSILEVAQTATFTKCGIEVLPMIPANRLNDFKSFIGVNTHIGNTENLYTNGSAVLTDLQTLGFTNIRDRVPPAASTSLQAVYQPLVTAGIKMLLIPEGDGAGTNLPPSQHIADLKASITAWGSNPLLGVESLNEPFGGSTLYLGLNSSTTSQGVAAYQQALYQLAHADPVLCNLPVVNISLAGGEQDNSGLQFLTVPPQAHAYTGCYAEDGTKFADVLNLHIYFTPVQQPLLTGADGDQFLGTASHLQGEFVTTYAGSFPGYANVQAVWPLPRWITEFGFQTNSSAGTGNYYDQATQGKVLLNSAFQAFIGGYSHFFIYDLYDNPTASDGYWGLFSTTATLKSSGTYFKNLMAILADSGTDYATFNAGSPGNILFTNLPALSRYHVFQKSDGSYWIALWACPVNWNNSTNTAITISGTSVTLTLPQTFPTVNVFDPTVGTTAQSTATNAATVSVTLKDYPVLIQLIPSASTTNVQWSIYAMANGVPTGSPIYTSANHTVPLAADVIEETGLSIALQPGTYAMCAVSNGPVNVRGIVDAGYSGLSGLATSKPAGMGLTFTTTLSSTPASTWPTNPTVTANLQATASPMIWVRL